MSEVSGKYRGRRGELLIQHSDPEFREQAFRPYSTFGHRAPKTTPSGIPPSDLIEGSPELLWTSTCMGGHIAGGQAREQRSYIRNSLPVLPLAYWTLPVHTLLVPESPSTSIAKRSPYTKASTILQNRLSSSLGFGCLRPEIAAQTFMPLQHYSPDVEEPSNFWKEPFSMQQLDSLVEEPALHYRGSSRMGEVWSPNWGPSPLSFFWWGLKHGP